MVAWPVISFLPVDDMRGKPSGFYVVLSPSFLGPVVAYWNSRDARWTHQSIRITVERALGPITKEGIDDAP